MDKKKAKHYGNHEPIIDCEGKSTQVIMKVSPPEFHLMLGTANHMYNELEKVRSDSED